MKATVAQILAFRAAAQHLGEPLPRERWTDAVAVGLQDTPPGSALLALAVRVEGVDPGMWAAERFDSRALVLSWSLRGSPYAHAAVDHDLFSVAALPTDEASWLAAIKWQPKAKKDAGMSGGDAVALVASEAAAVLADGPHTKPDLSTALRSRLPAGLTPFCKTCNVHHVGEQILRLSGLFGGFVLGPDEGGRFTLVRRDDWFGEGFDTLSKGRRSEPGDDAADLRKALLRRFLAWYGPADASMYAGWLGLSAAEGARRFDALSDELVEVAIPELGPSATRWLRADDADRLATTDPASVRGVRLLPVSDPYLQQRDRELFIPDPTARKRVWTALGGPGVVVVDGGAAGTWRAQKKGMRLVVTVDPWEPLDRGELAAVNAEAAVMATARGCTDVEVQVGEPSTVG